METRASYVLVGGFVIAAVVALLGFAAWLARAEIDRAVSRYDILFEGSVSGLGIGGDVRYRGFKVGTVTDIDIDPDDPGHVRVSVEVDSEIPIREGDEARLQARGVTGVAFINIEGADAGSPALTASAADANPVIPSRPSKLEELFESAPELITRATVLVDRASRLLDEENMQRFDGILADVQSVTASLADRREQIAGVLDSVDRASTDIAAATDAVRSLAERADGLLDALSATLVAARGTLDSADSVLAEDVQGLLGDARETARSVARLAAEAERTLADNRESLTVFASEGLPEFSRFVTEARLLVSNLSRVIERVESEGARFFFGGQGAEVEAR